MLTPENVQEYVNSGLLSHALHPTEVPFEPIKIDSYQAQQLYANGETIYIELDEEFHQVTKATLLQDQKQLNYYY